MYGNNYNNQKTTEQSVYSRIGTWYGEISMMSLSYWNDKISIKINPAKGKNAEGKTEYDDVSKIQTAIIPTKAYALSKEFVNKFQNHENEKISVIIVNPNNSSFGFEYDSDGDDIYLQITQPSSDGTLVKMMYKFNTTDVTITNSQGDNVIVKTHSEAMMFCNKLEKLHMISGSYSQSIKIEEANTARRSSYNNGGQQQSQQYQAPQNTITDGAFPWD